MNMAQSVIALRKLARQLLLRPSQLAIAATLVAIGVGRFMPAYYMKAVDQLIGRPGDTVILLVILLLGILLLTGIKRSELSPKVQVLQSPMHAPLQSILETHLQLDQEIDKKLIEVVGDTENSAIDIINQVRKLYDSANTLVTYLNNSSLQAENLGKDIADSVTYLVEIGDFIQQLPAKMTRDMDVVQSVVKEIKELSEMIGAVQAISMQSHLLAINAAIEGSRAGPSGAAFRIVAQEMRKLASNSSNVASKINDGLSRARHVVEDGMSTSIAESTQQLERVSHAVDSIQKLKNNFEDMSQYYKTRFTVLTKHNEDLATDISEVLGHIQYQDVVSQCIHRIRFAIGQRNTLLEKAADQFGQGDANFSELSELLTSVLNVYLTEEQKHKHSARHEAADNTELKFELF